MTGDVQHRVLLARHGETEWNRVGRRQGRLDSPLTARGTRQADAVAELAAVLGIDAVFASPLGRARATAERVGARCSLPVVVVDGLAEVDNGDFAGLTNPEVEELHPGELARRAAAKYTWAYPGGESYADADVRAAAALDAVSATGASAPLLVAHEMVGRMLLRHLLRLDPDTALRRSIAHGSVIETWPSTGRSATHSGEW